MPVIAFSKKASAYRKPDPILARDQLQNLQKIYKAMGAELFCALAPVWILKKKAESEEESSYLNQIYGHWNKRLVPFKWNKMQHELWVSPMDNRNIILKFRQGGSTTWMIIVRLWLPAILEPGTSSLLISQTKGYGAKHFQILKRAHKHFLEADPFDERSNKIAIQYHQHLLHTEFSNRHEIIYDQLDSQILVDTAENTEVGQGLPGIAHLGCTEVARWPHNPEETMSNPTESVVPGGTIDWESTANGMGGLFFEESQRAMRGESVYKFHFYDWHYADEYKIDDPKQQRVIDSKWAKFATEIDKKEEEAVKERFQLEMSQVYWRREKRIALRDAFYEKYPEDSVSCFLTSGRPFFDAAVCRRQYLIVQSQVKPIDVNKSVGWEQYFRPIPGRRYLIGADSAEGKMITNDEPDYNDFTVIDLETGHQMGRYHNRIPPEDYAYHIKDIAVLFNNALVAVENNPGGGGETVLVTLTSQLSYRNIFMYKKWSPVSKKVEEIAGMPTEGRTRKLMLNKLAFAIRTDPEIILDRIFWEQALTFVYNVKGRPEAQEGCFDDTVMCNAIAHFCRLVELGMYDPLTDKSKPKYGEEEVA